MADISFYRARSIVSHILTEANRWCYYGFVLFSILLIGAAVYCTTKYSKIKAGYMHNLSASVPERSRFILERNINEIVFPCGTHFHQSQTHCKPVHFDRIAFTWENFQEHPLKQTISIQNFKMLFQTIKKYTSISIFSCWVFYLLIKIWCLRSENWSRTCFHWNDWCHCMNFL